jgi:predicted PurR-regulated permease PerM
VQRRLAAALAQGSQFMATQAFDIGQNAFEFIASIFIALAAYGVFVIGLVDNVLRPMLVGKDARLPDYLVMITTLGGIAGFGINGLVLGPAIAAMFIAVWHIYVTTRPATY